VIRIKGFIITKVYTMRVSGWTLLVLGFVCSLCFLDTYGDNTDMKKGVNNGLKLQLPMVSFYMLLPKFNFFLVNV
jgi:hypothetical protein